MNCYCNKRILLLFVIVILFISGCAETQITLIPYNIAVHRNEQVSDNEHNRDVNIIKIDTDSTHSDTIFQAITQKFDTILDDYMNSVSYEFQNLVVDSTYCENEEFLCLAVIASLPSQYPIPYETECIFWNRAEDKLYSLGEYTKIIGIDLTSVERSIDEAVSGDYGALYESTIEGMFYLDNNIYFIIQVESNFENGINASETMFYNYSSSELILGKNFNGFNALIEG